MGWMTEKVEDSGEEEEKIDKTEEMREERVLLSVDGLDNNVIKIKPPMVFNIRDCQFLLQLWFFNHNLLLVACCHSA